MAEKSEKQTNATGYDGRLMMRILAFLRPYRWWVLLALVLVVAGAYLGPLRPRLIQIAIDNHIVNSDMDGLLRMVAILFLVLFAEAIVTVGSGYLTEWIGQQAIYDIRISVFRKILGLPLHYFDRTPIGRLITRTTNDVEALNDVLSAGIVRILGSLGKLVFIAFFMFTLNWKLALLTLAVMPIMVWSTFEFRKRVRDAFRETRRQIARLNAFIQEHVTGMSIVQLFNREDEELRRFTEVNNDHRKVQIKTIFYFALFWPSVDIIAWLAVAVVLSFSGFQAISGGLTVGVVIAFVQYVRQFFEPIRQLSEQYNTLQGAMAASERLFSVTDLGIEIPERSDPVALPAPEGRIRFENVWFTYDRDLPKGEEPNWILKDVSFEVSPAQTVALVGATGSGKTTIINLLMRFYDIQKGSITIDGIDIRDVRLKELRGHIGLVLQDVFLFSGSIEDNLTLGDGNITQNMIEQAAAEVGATRFIKRLPNGFQEDVKERGSSLSHGQRQLLSFIRALVYNPEILVLDEATSSVDTETETLIQHAMERLMQGRTSIAVAHRLSTIQNADQIFVVHRGEIRERGTHQELLAQDGLYRKLYELQYRDQEPAAA